ncbi:MAG: HEPN domain-containing protein [Anaerolineae bacterium]|nr:HEPN domain-containing protein [Anaerolineae bacterium]
MTEAAHEPWLRRARSNLAIARTGKSTAVMLEDLCFEAQQAAEKALKALLLTRLERHLSVPPAIREVVELTDYAVQVHYPGDYYPVSEDEYPHAVVVAERVLDWATDQIHRQNRDAATTSDV